MKRILMVAIALALVACEKPPEQTKAVGNGFNVERLFTHEGCTVYRFDDGGRYRYYTKCDTQSNVSWQEYCGKSCSKNVAISTSYVKQDWQHNN